MKFNALSQAKVSAYVAAPTKARLGDGSNLYVQASGAFIFRWRDSATGNIRTKGLGSTSNTTLADARLRRDEENARLRQGLPIIGARASRLQGSTAGMTFGSYVESIKASACKGKAARYATRFPQLINDFAKPLFSLPVASILPAQVASVLKAEWEAHPVNADHARNAIKVVFDFAIASSIRTEANPAEKAVISKLLGTIDHKSENHTGLPLAEMPGFVKSLRALDTVAALAFEFMVLTATRTMEVINMPWSEVDIEAATWTLPNVAGRMKTWKTAKGPHKIALCPRAVAILKAMQAKRSNSTDLVFVGGGKRGNLADNVFRVLLKGLEIDADPHAVARSTFTTWANDLCKIEDAVNLAEAALSHTIKDKVRRAYYNGDGKLEDRRLLMVAWQKFLKA